MAKAKLSKDTKKQLWILGWISIGLLLGGLIGGLAWTIGESEFQNVIVGMSIGPSTKLQGAFNFDYIDLESDDSRTMDYSTWHPERHFNTSATHVMNNYEWNIDPDFSSYGVPNVQLTMPAEYFPTDGLGNGRDEFIVTPTPITFQQEVDGEIIERTFTFYQTYVGCQFVVTIAGDKDIPTFTYLGQDFVDQAARAESPATFNQRQDKITDKTLIGNGVVVDFVIRSQIKEFMVGEASHSDPYTSSTNAFLWAKLGDVDTVGIEETMGWEYEGEYSGDVIDHTMKVMYPSVKDALLNTQQLPDTDVDEIQLFDTLYDTIYIKFHYEVKLGMDWNTNTYQWALTPMKMQGFQIVATAYFSITTAYEDPINLGQVQVDPDLIDNPFNEPDLPDIDFNLWDWLKNAWNTPWSKWIMIIIGIIVLVLIGYLFVRFGGLTLIRGMMARSSVRRARRAARQAKMATATNTATAAQNYGPVRMALTARKKKKKKKKKSKGKSKK